MKAGKRSWLQRLKRPGRLMMLVLGLVAVGMLVGTQMTQAQVLVQGDRVSEQEVIERDVLLTGDEVVLDGTVIGDVVALGNAVTIHGTIEGSLVTVAETIAINGQVEGSVYAGAATLELGELAAIDRSLYFLGGHLLTQPASQVGRDLLAVSLGASLGGNVGRDVQARVGLLEIIRIVMNAIDRETGQLGPIGKVDQPAPVESVSGNRFVLVSLTEPRFTKDATPARETLHRRLIPAVLGQAQQAAETNTQTEEISEWALRVLRQLVTFLIIGGLAGWLTPTWFNRSVERLRARPWASGGYGFVVFVMGFVGFFLLGLLVLAIGLAFRFLTLRALALTIWAVGFSGLWFAFFVFLLFVFFGSKLIVSHLGGKLILERIFPRAAASWVWPLLLGIILYVLIRSIPVIGWVIGLIVTFFGLGAMWLAFRERAISAPLVSSVVE